MTDPFKNRGATPSGPAHDYAPVTPDDATELSNVAIALYVEGGGVVAVETVKGNVRSIAVSDFGWLLCGVRRVLATGTTATGIHALTL